MNKPLSFIELKNNLSGKVFNYSLDDFLRIFTDEIAFVRFKVSNDQRYLANLPAKDEEGSWLHLITQAWNDLAKPHKNTQENQPLYSILSVG